MNHLKISRNGVIFVSLTLMLMLFGPTTMSATFLTDSNDLDCAHIQCPQKCPADSYLKSFVDNEDEEDLDDYEFDTATHEPYVEELGLFEQPPLTADLEAHHPYHHHVGKRQVSSQHDIERCCDDQHCACHSCDNVPQCAVDYVAIEVHSGNGIPGNCCSTYKCVLKIKCAVGVKQTYWKDKCIKCSCFGEGELCENHCPENDLELHCYSEYWQKPMLNGESWMEGTCTSCTCEQGDRRCVIPLDSPTCGDDAVNKDESVTEVMIIPEVDETELIRGESSTVHTAEKPVTIESYTSVAEKYETFSVENATSSIDLNTSSSLGSSSSDIIEEKTITTESSKSTSNINDSTALGSSSSTVNLDETSSSSSLASTLNKDETSTSESISSSINLEWTSTTESSSSTKPIEETSSSVGLHSSKTVDGTTTSSNEYTSSESPTTDKSSFAVSMPTIFDIAPMNDNSEETISSSSTIDYIVTLLNFTTEPSTSTLYKEDADSSSTTNTDLVVNSSTERNMEPKTLITIEDANTTSANPSTMYYSESNVEAKTSTLSVDEGFNSSSTVETISTVETSESTTVQTLTSLPSEYNRTSTILAIEETSINFESSTETSTVVSNVLNAKEKEINDSSIVTDFSKTTTEIEMASSVATMNKNTTPDLDNKLDLSADSNPLQDNRSSSTTSNLSSSSTIGNIFNPTTESITTIVKISTNVPKTTTINTTNTSTDIPSTNDSRTSTEMSTTISTTSSSAPALLPTTSAFFTTSSPSTSLIGNARVNDIASPTTSSPTVPSTTTAPGPLEPLEPLKPLEPLEILEPLEPLEPLFQQNHSPFAETEYGNHNSTQDQVRTLFDEIDYVVMIVLFIGALLCITLGLIIRYTKNRKKMYSSIPNSETSLSQTSTHTMMTV